MKRQKRKSPTFEARRWLRRETPSWGAKAWPRRKAVQGSCCLCFPKVNLLWPWPPWASVRLGPHLRGHVTQAWPPSIFSLLASDWLGLRHVLQTI